MSYFTDKHVIKLLINAEDLLSYSKRNDADDYLADYMDSLEDLKKVKEAFDKLDLSYQERINIFLFSGLNQTQMAERLKTKQPNVKRNFKRAIDKLVNSLNSGT